MVRATSMMLRLATSVLLVIATVSASCMISSDSSELLFDDPESFLRPTVSTHYADKCLGVHLFSLPVEQGSFNVVKYDNKLIIVDIGSSKGDFSSFRKKYNNELSKIFKDSILKGVVISHPDIDHYNWLSDLLNEKNLVMVSPKMRLFIGGGACKSKIKGCLQKLIKTLNNRTCSVFLNYMAINNDSSNLWKKSNDFIVWSAVEGGVAEIEQELQDCLSSVTFKFFEQVTPLKKNESNAHSLTFLVSCFSKNILFTGDATNATLSSIGCVEIMDGEFQFLSETNKKMLESTNMIICPHHGADTEKSQNWLIATMFFAKCNFECAIVPANPCFTKHHHPRSNATRKLLKNFSGSAIMSMPHRMIYYEGPLFRKYEKKTRTTHKAIFDLHEVMWFKFSDDGLQMFNHKKSIESDRCVFLQLPEDPITAVSGLLKNNENPERFGANWLNAFNVWQCCKDDLRVPVGKQLLGELSRRPDILDVDAEIPVAANILSPDIYPSPAPSLYYVHEEGEFVPASRQQIKDFWSEKKTAEGICLFIKLLDSNVYCKCRKPRRVYYLAR